MTLRLFSTYIAIGGFVFVCYMSLFQLLIARGFPLQACTTIAYFTGTAMHFTLNKYANFRNFDRAVHEQVRTFVVIIAMQWLVMLAMVTILSGHGVKPILATLIAIVTNVPLTFAANRYMTFGKGIRLAMYRLLKAPR